MLNFLGIGAQKAGTTWLYEMLNHHVDISFPAGKEVHFWNRQQQKVDWYNSLFINSNIAGDITPAYGFLSVKVIKQIYSYYPKIKLIYIIRNPIYRAWSSALMALDRAEMTITEASDQWFIDHFNSQGSLQRGDYEICIKNWLQVFPGEQLLILRFEEITTDPQRLLIKCCHHLNIDPTIYLSINNNIFQKKIFAGSGQSLRPSLYPFLFQIYQAKIIRLEKYLQQDFSNWLIPYDG
ncbi:MAG TPA: sulfotransferase [Thioploca sp.]|nr:sulfotransferase [Thioploca sp.]